MRVGGGEHRVEIAGDEQLIPFGLEEAAVGLVDFLDGVDVADVDSIWAGTNDRAFGGSDCESALASRRRTPNGQIELPYFAWRWCT